MNMSLDESSWHLSPAPDRPRPIQMKACLACRRVKMKCRLVGGETTCARCAQKSMQCVFVEHRRGRKPGTRITRKNGPNDSNKNLRSEPMTFEKEADNVPGTGIPVAEEAHDDSRFPAETSGLQPSELLNHEAMSGKFSMQRILDTQHHERSDTNLTERFAPASSQDAIELALVSQSIAEHLFESFMDILNPYISQLDPDLHTFSYVRQKSPFLLSSILAASAKVFNPALYRCLYQHAEDLFVDSFRVGMKSTETVQAILIMTYWKKPEDTRSWVNLGYAIRICMDLGWHKLSSQVIRHRNDLTEEQLREARNIERTWFVLFVYDRSMSLQTGKPWMIERNEFIEAVEIWSKESTATANDALLAAFVTLRLLTSEVFKLIGSCRYVNSFQNVKSFLAIINNRVDQWEDKWLRACIDESESCHPFLVRFYGTHLRLQLYSLPLQEILGSSDRNLAFDIQTLWPSYSNAIEMLKIVSSYSNRLYFAQDSIHVMTAYSAAFLIKLLMSAPTYITSEIEYPTIDTLRTACSVFFRQSAPPGSSCFLQARFLAKVISNYEQLRRTTHSRSSPVNNQSTTNNRTELHHDSHESEREIEPTRNNPMPMITRRSNRPGSSSNAFNNPEEPYVVSHHNSLTDHNNNPSSLDSPLSDEFHLPFADDETWTEVFNNAGFCIQDGVFFS